MSPCPFCGSTLVTTVSDGINSWGQCGRCIAKGPFADTQVNAYAAWEHRATTAESIRDRELGAKIMVDIGEMYMRFGKSIIEMHQKEKK